jgi:hypothetical protein
MRKRLLIAALIAAAMAGNALAEVLIVADEFPVMQAVAGKLKAEEHISSQLVAQKDLPASLGSFEAVIVYIHGALSERAEEAFIAYTEAGGKLVCLHHSISSGKRKNAHWFQFLGVSLPEGPLSSGGYKWTEGVSWELANLNPNHFIMTNHVSYPARVAYTSTNPVSTSGSLPGFALSNSEAYINHIHTESRTLLMGLKYKDAGTGTTYMQDRAGWIKPAGKGWIVYLMPGHRQSDFDNVAYGRIVLNAVIWKP